MKLESGWYLSNERKTKLGASIIHDLNQTNTNKINFLIICRERREKYAAASNPSNRKVDFSNRGGAADFVDSRYHFAGRYNSVK